MTGGVMLLFVCLRYSMWQSALAAVTSEWGFLTDWKDLGARVVGCG